MSAALQLEGRQLRELGLMVEDRFAKLLKLLDRLRKRVGMERISWHYKRRSA